MVQRRDKTNCRYETDPKIQKIMKLTAMKRYTRVCIVLGFLIIIVSSCKFSDDIKKDIHYTDLKFKGVVTLAPTQE